MAHFNVYAEMTGTTKTEATERPSRKGVERSVNHMSPPLMALAKIGIAIPQ